MKNKVFFSRSVSENKNKILSKFLLSESSLLPRRSFLVNFVVHALNELKRHRLKRVNVLPGLLGPSIYFIIQFSKLNEPFSTTSLSSIIIMNIILRVSKMYDYDLRVIDDSFYIQRCQYNL